MEKLEYKQIHEVLYREVLPNGLKVFLLPKAGYHKTYGLFSTNYGSIDNKFGYEGESLDQVPDGIAHFLEHKLFEKEEGDIFQTFSKFGASANAFTSFTRTSYLFSTSDYVFESLATLLDFVQEPYFTKETVEKEKGIIGQEIQMYNDDAGWRQFFGILGNMYPNHPLHVDIAGSIESIAEITAEDLYHCYQTFYHPSNMTLFVVGDFNPLQMITFIKENQAKKSFPAHRKIVRYFPEQTYEEVQPFATIQLPVTREKAVLGVKGLEQNLPVDARERVVFRTAIQLLLQLLVGSTSKAYLDLYNRGILDDTFGFEFTMDRGFHLADFSTDTDQPTAFCEAMTALLLGFEENDDLNEENLVLVKKKMLGKYFQSLNSLEYIANQFTQELYDDVTLFDLPEVIQAIQLKDIFAAGKVFLKPKAFSRFYVEPLDKSGHESSSKIV
jgi:predicted Zn-dependent peptidase